MFPLTRAPEDLAVLADRLRRSHLVVLLDPFGLVDLECRYRLSDLAGVASNPLSHASCGVWHALGSRADVAGASHV